MSRVYCLMFNMRANKVFNTIDEAQALEMLTDPEPGQYFYGVEFDADRPVWSLQIGTDQGGCANVFGSYFYGASRETGYASFSGGDDPFRKNSPIGADTLFVGDAHAFSDRADEGIDQYTSSIYMARATGETILDGAVLLRDGQKLGMGREDVFYPCKEWASLTCPVPKSLDFDEVLSVTRRAIELCAEAAPLVRKHILGA